ncbi:hypothetical protein [Ahrensia sp. 13_GOM-1096m]|uniref:hypothetical protein n=1 Tax=Ahrensia sp. 13_GOM-1096m TaxID=1380380 RepID=UPI000479F447|nr:hypothetical protein [Ahrensia sp. 13_GOM-1096m]
MLNYLDTPALLMVGIAVVMSAFFIGAAMNGILENLAFGTISNMIILTLGAFLGFYLGGIFLPYSHDAAYIAIVGVCGGFMLLAVLMALKMALSKFGI